MTSELIIIGAGHQADKIYFPVIRDLIDSGKKINLRAIVDTSENKDQIQKYLKKWEFEVDSIDYISADVRSPGTYSNDQPKLFDSLDGLVSSLGINCAILGTDPISRIPYLDWAIEKELHIYSEKPLTAHPFASTDSKQAQRFIDDHMSLLQRTREKDLIFMVNLHRRTQEAYIELEEMVKQIASEKKMPISSIAMNENCGRGLLSHDYFFPGTHSMCEGIGKLTFSGYHYLDIMLQIAKASQVKGLKIDNAQVYASIRRPYDLLTELGMEAISDSLDEPLPKLNPKDIEKLKEFGDVDASVTIDLKHKDKLITQMTLRVEQSGYSFRDWNQRDYDWVSEPGRNKQDFFRLQQGPYLFAQHERLQLKGTGGEQGNQRGDKNHRSLTWAVKPSIETMFGRRTKEVIYDINKSPSGVNYDDYALLETFFDSVINKEPLQGFKSPSIEDTLPVTIIMAKAYESVALAYQNKNPICKFEFKL